MIRDVQDWRLVPYEVDILSHLLWGDIDLVVLDTPVLANGRGADVLLRTKLTERGRVPEVGNDSGTGNVEVPDDG